VITLLDNPFLICLVSFFTLTLAALGGGWLARRAGREKAAQREGFAVIEASTLTLLGLIIGFTFSMALNRYDQRKNYEEAEANAIGTEYLRADLLPSADAMKLRALLVEYLNQRVLFYTVRDSAELGQINLRTAGLQADLWSVVRAPAAAQPTPVVALAVAGMNDVLNSQGYTQAAWWNRIPVAAWALMMVIAVCSNILVGYGARNAGEGRGILLVLPAVVSVAFLLIADIDSPRGGAIHVSPQNLLSLIELLRQ
jgi:hypothetical protein